MDKILMFFLLCAFTSCTMTWVEMNFPENTYDEVLDTVIDNLEEPYA